MSTEFYIRSLHCSLRSAYLHALCDGATMFHWHQGNANAFALVTNAGMDIVDMCCVSPRLFIRLFEHQFPEVSREVRDELASEVSA